MQTRLVRSARAMILSTASVALLAAGWGCDSGRPAVESSTEEAKVTGKVTIKGKTATKGKVIFDPSNVERKMAPVAKADIAPDGSYSITTLIGDNIVRVEGPDAEKGGVLLDLIPVDIKPGANELAITLPNAEGPSKTADPVRGR